MKRSFLFLQGVCSPFFARLADRLARDGHRIAKINFNAGDAAYWGLRPALSFRGRPEELDDFVAAAYRRYDITDQILFGDCRPVHGPAVQQGRASGVRTHVFEEGYFRPHWITLERDGVNARSSLPRDPDWYRKVGPQLASDDEAVPFSTPFWTRAGHDVTYNISCLLNSLLYPHYRTHSLSNMAVAYASFLRRMRRVRRLAARDSARARALEEGGTPYYVLPLQLGTDAQIRFHSSFQSMRDVMDFAMASFAKFAPPESRLVIKNHPLDFGLVDNAKACAELAEHYGLRDRIDFIESGNLSALARHATGTVTVNSTAGGVALSQGCPTIALGDPIYNLPGLTFRNGLDRFWQEAVKPDAELFKCFHDTVVRVAQVNGGFYSGKGIDMAVRNSAATLAMARSPLEMLL